MLKKTLTAAIALLLIAATFSAVFVWNLLRKVESSDPVVWERSISRFEASDSEHGFPANGIVFAGSSSVALFDGLDRLMAPFPVIRRGFGGASVPDIRYFRQRIIDKYQPEKIVLYAGGIDLYYHHPENPEKVVLKLRELFEDVLENNPGADVVYIAIRPSPYDPEMWEGIAHINDAVAGIAETDERLLFADANASVRDASGELRKDLYMLDRRHLNAKGNGLWWNAIKEQIFNYPRDQQ